MNFDNDACSFGVDLIYRGAGTCTSPALYSAGGLSYCGGWIFIALDLCRCCFITRKGFMPIVLYCSSRIYADSALLLAKAIQRFAEYKTVVKTGKCFWITKKTKTKIFCTKPKEICTNLCYYLIVNNTFKGDFL